MDDVWAYRLDRPLPTYYRDVRGIVHVCEVRGDAPGELFVRTLCNRDAPPKEVFSSDTTVAVTCDECLARHVWTEDTPYGG
jgi:hypothetical protein